MICVQLEAGLIETQIERLNNLEQNINAKRSSIFEPTKQSSSIHLELLIEIFDVLWDLPEKLVTLHEVRVWGLISRNPKFGMTGVQCS